MSWESHAYLFCSFLSGLESISEVELKQSFKVNFRDLNRMVEEYKLQEVSQNSSQSEAFKYFGFHSDYRVTKWPGRPTMTTLTSFHFYHPVTFK